MNYIILSHVFDSCASWNFLPDIEIIAWMVNHTALLQKWNAVHVAWMNYGCRLTRISISRAFDKAEWNLTLWKAEGSRKIYRPIHMYWCICWKKMSEWVTHKKRNDEDWQCSSVSSVKVITAKKKRGGGGWLMPCFPMWLAFTVVKYF